MKFDLIKFGVCFSSALIIVVLVSVVDVYAQNYVDLFKVEYGASNGNNFNSQDNSSDIKEFNVDLTMPIRLSESRTLISGFLYENLELSPYAGMEEYNFYTLNLKAGINEVYSDKWSATYMILPKISSSLQSLNGDDKQLGLLGLFKREKNENLNFKYGAYYNTDSFGPYFVPLFGFYYQKNKLELKVLLPTSFDVNYQFIEGFSGGLRFQGTLKSFSFSDKSTDNRQYMTKANNELLSYISLYKRNLLLIVSGGYSIGRSYRAYSSGDNVEFAFAAINFGDNRTQLNTDFSDGLVIRTSLIYRFKFKNE